jgi:hypothetical protein
MRKHELDVTALVWGLMFLITSGVVISSEMGGPAFDLKWLLPAGLVALGVGGMANAIRHSRR